MVSCDLCGSSEDAVLFVGQNPRIPTEERSFRVVECWGCGLIFLSPMPEGSEPAAYYAQDYHDDLGRGSGLPRRRAASLRRLRQSIRRLLLERYYHYPSATGGPRAKASSNGLLRLMTAACVQMERWRLSVSGREAAIVPFVGEGRLLDVGCGSGKGLESFKELGWDVTGVEMSPYAASKARERLGCEILVGDFEQIPLDNERFDVVRFSHSLEHLQSPRKAMEKASRVLRPSGLLWIEVPNAASLERRLFGAQWFCWDLPRHLYHFTPETLARLLARTGFRPVKIKCDGRVLFTVESLSNVLAHRLGIRPRRTKFLSAIVRPLTYALGAMNRGSILTVHARKDPAWSVIAPGVRNDMPSGVRAG